ncbi:HyaD/HybD family hydrogenase maturation endopeptidase [Phosphitispora fastidiosa]|uniref:HyaD/HybD family hydrogenase maturation endopeptidase n=1 Tax=Phosphitispora fastidiosa TaxID=2837202 RepID=UPI001E2C13A1|nr:HyaD/HybD family hydrogenase maturation endopeptidase [Phosphitispora fastidiosa]MBU7006203.1 hydrogenase maturation protease [Phosphitispora fastidiosa]
MAVKNKVLVLGVGNSILSDEGLGVHLVKRLQEEEFPDNVEMLEGGTQGLELLAYIDDVAKLIIIDCVKAGAEPGSIFRFEPDKVNVIPREFKISYHDLGIYDFLQQARLLESLPPTIIFGVEPKEIDWGEELSTPVAAAMGKLKALVTDEIIMSLRHLEP